MFYYIFAAIVGYLIGSIPCGYLLVKFVHRKDIREFGSGNIGATNIWRAGYKNLAIMTFALDAFKALFAIFMINQIGVIFTVNPHTIKNASIIAGFFAVIGHVYSLYLHGRGGKGVATMIGFNLYLSLTMSILGLALWYGVFRFTRYSSLSSLIFIGFNLIFGLLFVGPALAKIAIFLLSCLIFYQHKDNIKRLMNNEESKL
jgi:glycerol-3-phosphate acyltransferase PlsY